MKIKLILGIKNRCRAMKFFNGCHSKTILHDIKKSFEEVHLRVNIHGQKKAPTPNKFSISHYTT